MFSSISSDSSISEEENNYLTKNIEINKLHEYEKENLKKIIRSIKDNKTEKMNLNNMNITNINIPFLEKYIIKKSNLKEIDLSNNMILDLGLQNFKKMILTKKFVKINLTNTSLTNKSIDIIEDIIDNNKVIEISLEFNKFNEEGVNRLYKIFEKYKHLKIIFLFGNYNINNENYLKFKNIQINERNEDSLLLKEKIFNLKKGFIEINENFIIGKEIIGK
jgi:hypothetical protein